MYIGNWKSSFKIIGSYSKCTTPSLFPASKSYLIHLVEDCFNLSIRCCLSMLPDLSSTRTNLPPLSGWIISKVVSGAGFEAFMGLKLPPLKSLFFSMTSQTDWYLHKALCLVGLSKHLSSGVEKYFVDFKKIVR